MPYILGSDVELIDLMDDFLARVPAFDIDKISKLYGTRGNVVLLIIRVVGRTFGLDLQDILREFKFPQFRL